MTAIRLDAVSKVFEGEHLAVDELSLEIGDGEFMVLLGPSGCGKTTLLRMIAGLERVTAGEVWFGRTNGTRLPPRDRQVAMVFQTGALYPNRTVQENIMFPLQIAGQDDAQAGSTAVGLAQVLSIDSVLDRMPRTLSGGQRQRVAIGRALVRRPRVFLLDEPLSNLDATMRTELRQEIGAMTRDLNVTTLYVTHDQVEALTLADRIAVMRDGRIEDVGTPTQVYNDPATAFVAGFLGTPRINLMSATVRVTAHHRVSLDLGTQSIHLDPTDRRSLILRHHDGAQVIVGARSSAFSLITDQDTANRLTGTIRAFEFHGQQSIAFVHCGIEVVDPDKVGRTTPSHASHDGTHGAGGTPSILTRLRTKLARRPPTALPEFHGPATHRRADLVVELPVETELTPGTRIHLALDTTRIHIFDQTGHRVDRLTR
ncbi:ABC transporter ATP-binding protein [Kribbella shirazensis]|uniref:Multiple sugar transport system ATP-binding protein n=1 Tax=Kribbella shirazensis TaxID=1105143 RepID=A0A7X5VE00_9ACTN|nr:ABC transporter ATP-binding protein [Kribbella shirazensis]NIK58598.1 multiple sugar transport system ATP-binding protein [Kribbella shirazensis]